MNIKTDLTKAAAQAKQASRQLVNLSTPLKNKVLLSMAGDLIKNASLLIKANNKDVVAARKRGLSSALIDRLLLDRGRIARMAQSLRAIARLKDPVGEEITRFKRPNGLLIKKVRVPIGVIAVIYESRPNVTSDCVGLCLKSGNAVILRGGKEAIHSNKAIYRIIGRALSRHAIPRAAVTMITSTDRKAVDLLLSLRESIDLVIPRGGEGLIELVSEKSKIAVIRNYKGVCHTYVDADAEFSCALRVAFNAKVQRPGVCNAMETLLVHKAIAKNFLPLMAKQLSQAKVEIRGDSAACKTIKCQRRAREADWSTEYLDLILAVKVVGSTAQAIAHINRYGSGHSDAIITQNKKHADQFLKQVDSACVYHNASTRFTDGYEFGLGAEIGISTDKIHARGPMGLVELTTYKYEILGQGQIRS